MAENVISVGLSMEQVGDLFDTLADHFEHYGEQSDRVSLVEIMNLLAEVVE